MPARGGERFQDPKPEAQRLRRLSDLKVREAVAYAIDKETLSEGLTYGEETPADHLFPDGIPIRMWN